MEGYVWGQLPRPPATDPDQTIITFLLNILAPCRGGPSMWISGTRISDRQQLIKTSLQAA